MSHALAQQLNPTGIKVESQSTPTNPTAVDTPPFPTINTNDLDFHLEQLPDEPEDVMLSQVLDQIEKEYGLTKTDTKVQEDDPLQQQPPAPQINPQPPAPQINAQPPPPKYTLLNN